MTLAEVVSAVGPSSSSVFYNKYDGKYGHYRWGFYTEKQSDAFALAIALGTSMLAVPEVHGLYFYGHYHPGNRSIRNVHIWYGLPIVLD